MSYVVAGAFSGLLMASVFGAIGPIILFRLFTHPTPFLERIRARVPPMAMMMGVVLLSYPVWILLGVLAALVYWVSVADAAAGGPVSPDLVYSVAIVLVAVAVAVPIAVLMRRVLVGLAALTLVFIADFGWLLPLLAG